MNKSWSLYQFFNRFPDNQSAKEHMENMRWGDTPFCPHCGSVGNAARVKNEKPMPWRCRDCRKHFSVKTKTIFAKSNLSYHKCLLAIYLLTIAKKGISSYQFAKELGCQQKTAWYLAHRIRGCMEQGQSPLSGVIEADETWFGGKEHNKPKSKRRNDGKRGPAGKQAVMGMVERDGEVRAQVVSGVDKTTLQSAIKANVSMGSKLFTDELRSYKEIDGYEHEAVKHSVGEYVNGMAHTNSVESFWALLKRGYYGVYHQMSFKHLHRYVDEFAVRHNRRNFGTEANINAVLREMEGKSLPYKELIA